MSEYWVSKKKYYCKYCEIYIADDKPSRQQHENGMRHKGNLERFINGIYKGSVKRKRDQEEEQRELAQVDKAAQAAYAQDVAAGRAKPVAPVASTSSTPAPRKPAGKPSNPYANYTTAASLGYTDPDAERITAEAERRRTQGVAGEWEVVATINRPTLDDETENEDVKPETTENTSVKREAEVLVDEEDTRSFKLRKKSWYPGLDGGYDPGHIPIKLKKKEETEELSTPASTSASAFTSVTAPQPTDAPKWVKVQWKRPGETSTQESASDLTFARTEDAPALATQPVLQDEVHSPVPPEEELKPPPVKAEEGTAVMDEPSVLTSSMFRKRKVPTSGGSRRGQ